MADDFPLPFRWDLQKRSTFQTMLSGEVAPSYAGFEADLLSSCARILAQAHGADLCFVGRSLDSVFDHLSGLLLDTSWQSRTELLPLSLWRSPSQALNTPERRRSFQRYLRAQGWDPRSIAERPRPVALTDLIATGATLGGIVTFLRSWCEESGVAFETVARQLRVVGLTCREKTSPNTWRWEQHAEWVSLLKRRNVKNVSAPVAFYGYLGNTQPKLSLTFGPDRWGESSVRSPVHGAEQLQALRLAVRLFDMGRERERREAFAQELSRQPPMRERWLRSLVVEIRQNRAGVSAG